MNKIKYIDSLLYNDISFDYLIYHFNNQSQTEKIVSPIKVGLKITNNCNFSCNYCFVDKSCIKELAFSDVKEIFGKFEQLPYEIYITGGEPTLNKDFKKITKYLADLGIDLKLHTSGFIEDKSVEKFILENKNYKSIQISIDSIKNYNDIRINDKKDSLYIVTNFAKEVIRSGIHVVVNIVLSKINICELDEILCYCYINGLKVIRLSPIFTANKNLIINDIEQIEYYVKTMKKYTKMGVKFLSSPIAHPWSLSMYKYNEIYDSNLYCPAQKSEFEIDMEGNVYPCPFLHDKKHCMGNILYEEFDKVWGQGVKALNKSKWNNTDKCKKCKSYKYCGGGCYALAYVANKESDIRCIYESK